MASFKNVVLGEMPDGDLGFDTQLIELSANSLEYKLVLKHLSSTMQSSISKIQKIHCPSLYGWYMIKKAEYESRGYEDCEKTLVHVTGASNISSILRSNLNWRRVNRHKFGKGISFADDAAYANQYAAMSIGLDRAIIIADVLIGKCFLGNSWTDLPPYGCDTTTGNRHVFVKFYDDEFLPKYVVYYTSPPIVIRRRFNRFRF